MNWRRVTAGVCALALIPFFPGEQQARQADSLIEMEVDPPLVALTFDDGPRNKTTGPLLDGLALREVPSTFFLVGSRIAGSEELLHRMKEEGHQIGIHTYDHVIVAGLSKEEFDLQVSKTTSLLTEILGEGDYWLRPPYGIVDEAVKAWSDFPLILWSVDPEDWKDENIDRIVAEVVGHVRDGDIILMHDLFPSSVEAALQVVDRLLDQGYCFVTVAQLLEERGVKTESGEIYRRVPPENSK